jgi:metal-dependent amidase/aminoacylase/carboxypeptidase family protein
MSAFDPAQPMVVTDSHGSGRSVTNFGIVHVHPGVGGIVPARGELLHEMREPDPNVLDRLALECTAPAKRVAKRHNVQVELRSTAGYRPHEDTHP